MIEIITKEKVIILEKLEEIIIYLQIYRCDLRIDFHGVLDLVDEDIILNTKKDIAVITFVCYNTINYHNTKKSLINRIYNNQIKIGILTFIKGYNTCKNTFTDIYSKAWINKIIPSISIPIFIDDTKEHIKSTITLLQDNIICILFKGTKYDLIDLLKTYN